MNRETRHLAAALACSALTLFAQPAPRATANLVAAYGLYKAVFRIPEGRITVSFPNDVTVGDVILASISSEPSGTGTTVRDGNSEGLSAYAVELDGSKMLAGGRLRWNVPTTVPSGYSAVRLRDRKGAVLAQSLVPVAPAGADHSPPPKTASVDLPLGARAGAPVSLWGAFPGDLVPALRVGGFAALVIAQSPRKIIFVSPPDVVGPSSLAVQFGAADAVRGPFHVLAAQSSASPNPLLPGKIAEFTVRVSGLSGLAAPAVLVLANPSPAIGALSGGTVQKILIPPGEVRPDGTWQVTRTLTGERGGQLSIGVAVSQLPSAEIPLGRLTERSIDRWSRRSNVPVAAAARRLLGSEVASARTVLDQYLLSQLAFEADPATLLDSLLRNYCFDLRDRKLTSSHLGLTPPAARPRLSLAFAPQPAPQPVTIEASDVRGNPLLKYLGELLATFVPSQPCGLLMVTSQPDKQQIRIGRNTGLDYFTARSFHLSAGDYTVSVAGCTEQIRIRPNQQSTMTCPRK